MGVITREVTDMPEEEVGKGSESPEATNAIDGKVIIKTWYIWTSELVCTRVQVKWGFTLIMFVHREWEVRAIQPGMAIGWVCLA